MAGRFDDVATQANELVGHLVNARASTRPCHYQPVRAMAKLSNVDVIVKFMLDEYRNRRIGEPMNATYV